MRYLVVTAAIIEQKGKILLSQRKENGKHPLKWEFPGGKLELGESPEEGLRREIKEELGFEIEVHKLFWAYAGYEQEGALLLFYRALVKKGEPRIIDCKDFAWASPSRLLSYDLTKGDYMAAKKLVEEWEIVAERKT